MNETARLCKQCSTALPAGHRSFCPAPAACRSDHDKARRKAERRGEPLPAARKPKAKKKKSAAEIQAAARRSALSAAAEAQGKTVIALLRENGLDPTNVYRHCKTGFTGHEKTRTQYEKAGILGALTL